MVLKKAFFSSLLISIKLLPLLLDFNELFIIFGIYFSIFIFEIISFISLSSSITGILNELAKICAYFLTNKREYLSSVLNVIG